MIPQVAHAGARHIRWPPRREHLSGALDSGAPLLGLRTRLPFDGARGSASEFSIPRTPSPGTEEPARLNAEAPVPTRLGTGPRRPPPKPPRPAAPPPAPAPRRRPRTPPAGAAAPAPAGRAPGGGRAGAPARTGRSGSSGPRPSP